METLEEDEVAVVAEVGMAVLAEEEVVEERVEEDHLLFARGGGRRE